MAESYVFLHLANIGNNAKNIIVGISAFVSFALTMFLLRRLRCETKSRRFQK